MRMPAPLLPEYLLDLLARPNPAVMATLRKDGQPVTVATWYVLDDDRRRLLVNLDEGRARLGHLRRDPRVSLTVFNGSEWYSHLSVQGRVVELREDPDLSGIDRIATHYTGRPFRNREAARVNAWIEIASWHAWELDPPSAD
jgi:PPOX class probable F420-dependent enzyme